MSMKQYIMIKSTYESPSVQAIELCSESALLAVSDATKNPYYSLDWDEEDNEFA